MLVQNPAKKQQIARYKLSRAYKVRTTGRKFAKLPAQVWKDELAKTFGIFGGAEPQTVRLQLTAVGAKLLEECPVDPSQQITLNADGTGEAVLMAGITPELRNKLMAHGLEALVIEPVTLRDEIGEIGRGLAAWAEARVK